MSMRDDIERLLRPIRLAIRTQILRTVLQSLDDSGTPRLVKVSGLFDDSFAGLEHLEPYGFTSSPAAGAEGLLVQVAGGPSNRLVFLLFNRNARPTGIDPSASAMYDTDGIKVYCLPGGGLSLGAKSATKGVARDQDPVSAGTTMEAWIAKVSTLLNTPGPVIGVAGSVTPPTDFGVISDASRSVKAAD